MSTQETALKEIVFQGVFNARTPVRYELSQHFSEIEVPSSMQPEELHTLLVALLYADRLDAEERRKVEFGRDVKLALSFDTMGQSWRILRREDDASLRLQLKEVAGFRDVAQGAEVTRALQEKMKFPPFPIFAALHLWRFMSPLPQEQAAFSLARLDDKARELVNQYKLAMEREALEDQVRELDEAIERTRQRMGDGAKLEENLGRAHDKLKNLEIAELSREDMALLHERDERLNAFAHQILRLEAEEEQAREEVNMTLPDKPWKSQVFLVGLVIAIGAAVVSIALSDTMRPLAAANVVGLGMSAWVMLRYFNDMERASVHVVRQDSIKRRLTQVREDQVAFKERIGHLLIHAGVQDEAELLERFEKSKKLKEMIQKMEAQLGKIRERTAYREAKRELDDIHARLEPLRQRKAHLPPATLTSYQIDRDLTQLGIDPAVALNTLNSNQEEDAPDYERDPFTRLREIARRAGLVQERGPLDPQVLAMWSKICGHVMGPRFKEVTLSPDGALQIAGLGGEQLDMWAKTRPRELRVVAMGLATALLVNLPGKMKALNTVLIPNLQRDLSSEHSTKMREVLQSAARAMHIVHVRGGTSS